MPEAHKIKILLIDDSFDLAHLYRLTIELEDDMECVAALSTTKDLTEQVRRLAPDVVLMDLVIPGENVLGAVSELRAAFPALHILMLSGYEAPGTAEEAARAGASGYISKNSEPEDVLRTVRRSMGRPPASGAPA